MALLWFPSQRVVNEDALVLSIFLNGVCLLSLGSGPRHCSTCALKMSLQSQEQVHEHAEKPVDAQSKTSGSQSDVPNASEKTAATGDLPGWKAFLIWLAISFGVLCTFLDEGIIATAIPRITDDFGSLKDVGVSKCKFDSGPRMVPH